MNKIHDLSHQTSEQRRDEFIAAGWYVSIPLTLVPSSWLSEGEQRLDGSYYATEAVAASQVINHCGFPVTSLATVTDDIFILGRFKRVYATNEDAGWPYLSASEALEFRPVSERYIAQDQAPKSSENHFVKPNWILLSSSGSVGRMVLTTTRLSKFFLTHDLIRILPNQNYAIGYIYAYLSSKIGQSLIAKDQYGSAIKHLEPHHLANIPVPLLPDEIQQEIHDKIMQAYALRDSANELLDQADALIHQELSLPRFNEELVPYLPAPITAPPTQHPPMPHPKAFTVNTSGLSDRFDASFHVPIIETIIKTLAKSKYKPVQLKHIVDQIIVAPRFKRVYVPKEYGSPFLQGSHLPQMRPYGLKYLSKTQQKDIDRWIIRKGWVLVTCSGTIGRVGMVSSYLDEWTASQHLLRVTADEGLTNPGYIAAFLFTPYGQHQLKSKIYGGVVDELTEFDMGEIWITNAPIYIQEEIGKLVIEAYEKKDQARILEQEAIDQVDKILNPHHNS